MTANPGDVWVSPCGKMELRCGRWQEVLADVGSVDAVITDPPYSATTHAGALDATTLEKGVPYPYWDRSDLDSLFGFILRASCWVVIHTDDILGPVIRGLALAGGRYAFPLLPVLQQQPRVTGDGPPQHGHYLAVSRPKERRFLSWGSLPGWYVARRDGSLVRGGKPLGLMRQIVRDYSRPGDLICDPCAGGATTLLAAAIEGRTAIGAEMDPKTFELAVKRLSAGYTPNLQLESKPKPKQGKLIS